MNEMWHLEQRCADILKVPPIKPSTVFSICGVLLVTARFAATEAIPEAGCCGFKDEDQRNALLMEAGLHQSLDEVGVGLLPSWQQLPALGSAKTGEDF